MRFHARSMLTRARGRRLARRVGVAVGACLLLALGGCAGVRTRPTGGVPAPAWTSAALAERSALLRAIPDWRLSARVAITTGKQGGSGQLDWQQRGAAYRIAFDAPLNAQGWRLEGDRVNACLEGLAGGPRCGADADGLLTDVLQQPVPLAALSDWLRGTPAADERFGAPTPVSTDRGDVGFEQAGWRIVYTRWGAPTGWPLPMPQALTLTRDDLRLRLVVDGWQAGAP